MRSVTNYEEIRPREYALFIRSYLKSFVQYVSLSIMSAEIKSYAILPAVRTHIVINCIVELLVLIVISLRITTRFISRTLGCDDVFILIAMVRMLHLMVLNTN